MDNLYTYKVINVYKVYDGDTVHAEIDLGFGISNKIKVRLSYIDAPEIRGPERIKGLISRNYLRERFENALKNKDDIIIKTIKDRKGKYGRYLGEFFINGISINNELIEKNLAEKYGEK